MVEQHKTLWNMGQSYSRVSRRYKVPPFTGPVGVIGGGVAYDIVYTHTHTHMYVQ